MSGAGKIDAKQYGDEAVVNVSVPYRELSWFGDFRTVREYGEQGIYTNIAQCRINHCVHEIFFLPDYRLKFLDGRSTGTPVARECSESKFHVPERVYVRGHDRYPRGTLPPPVAAALFI